MSGRRTPCRRCGIRPSRRLAGSRPTSGRPRPRRPGRSCASPRPAAARRRRSSPGSPGSIDAGVDPGDDRGDHLQPAGRRRSSRERLATRARAARPRAGRRPGPDVPRPRPGDPPRRRRAGRAAGRPAGLLRRLAPDPDAAGWRRLDTAFSRLKLDLGRDRGRGRGGPRAGPARPGASSPTSAALAARGGLDFDDLVARALRLLEADAGLLARWRAALRRTSSSTRPRTSTGPSSRLALLLAAPGEPDLPRRRRRPVDLWLAARRRPPGPRPRGRACRGSCASTSSTNYRCPRPVVERAVRLVEHNASGSRRRSGPGRTPRAGSSWRRRRRRPSSGSARVLDSLAATTARPGRSSRGRTASCSGGRGGALRRASPFRAPRTRPAARGGRLDGALADASLRPARAGRLAALRPASDGRASEPPTTRETVAARRGCSLPGRRGSRRRGRFVARSRSVARVCAGCAATTRRSPLPRPTRRRASSSTMSSS